MKVYSKNQLAIIITIIVGILYSLYLEKQYYEVINKNDVREYIVIQQNCNYAPRMSSSVVIMESNKKYHVKLDEKDCGKYPKSSKIKVFYSNSSDIFIYKVENYNGKNRFKLLIISLFISFLPWSFWITRLEKKNSR